MADNKTVAIRVAVENVDQAIRLLKGLGDEGQQAFQRLLDGATKTGPGLKQAADGVGDFASKARANLQNFNYQLQDFVVQVQSGQNAAMALGQQLPQFASGFGPWGAAIGTASALVIGLGGALLGLTEKVKETPDDLGKLIGLFDGMGKAAEDAQKKIAGLTEAQAALVRQQAAGQGKSLVDEANKLSPQLTKELREAYLRQEIGGVDLNDEQSIGQEYTKASAAAGKRFDDLNSRIVAAVAAGKPDEVASLIGELGLQGTQANQDLTNKILDAAKRKGLADAIGSDAGSVPELGPGFSRFQAAPFVPIAGDNVVVPLDDATRGPTPVPFNRDQVEAARDAYYEELAQKRKSLIDQITGASSQGETPDQAIARINKQLDETKQKLEALRRPEGDNSDIDGALKQAETNAAQQIRAAKERAAREAEVLATKEKGRQSTLDDAKAEAEGAQRLVEAKRADLEASRNLAGAQDANASASQKVQRELESERRIREAAKTLTAAQLVQFKDEEKARLAAIEQQDQLNAALKEQNKYNQDKLATDKLLRDLSNEQTKETNPRQAYINAQVEKLPDQVDPVDLQKVLDAAGKAYDSEERRKQRAEYIRQETEVLVAPWKNLATQVASITGQMFDEFLATGKISLDKFATSLSGGVRGIVSQTLGTIVTQPLQQGVASLSTALTQSLANGQGLSGGFAQWAQANPGTAALGAGALGLTAANTITSVTGGNQTGSTIGGLLGGGAGAGIGFLIGGPAGMAVGAGLGSLLGGTVGGLFGGGEQNLGNDRAALDFWTGAGTTWQDKSSSPENRQAVNAFAKQVDSLTDILQGLGGTVANVNLRFAAGNKSGLEFNGQTYASQDALMAAVFRFVGSNTTGLSDNQQRVLANSKAGSVGDLSSDLSFAEQLDRFRQNLGPVAQQLKDLEASFKSMQQRAGELGLETKGLTEAYQKQVEQIKDGVRNQIAAFTGDRTSFGAAIDQVKQQAEDLIKAAQEIGAGTGAITEALKRRIADIQQQAQDQVDAFRNGGSSGYKTAYDNLTRQFEAATAIANDTGIDQYGLSESLATQRAKLREQAIAEIETFTKPAAINQFNQLTAEFERLLQVANDVGAGADELTAAYQRQKEAMQEAAEQQIKTAQQSLTDQTRGLTGLFDQYLDPIKQALGPFGLGSGITAPAAQVSGGIDLFRQTMAAARQGDTDALQSIVGIGQQTISAAKTYGATGDTFRDVFGEVNRGLAELQNQLQDKQTAALKGIENVGKAQLDEMVRLRLDGINGLRDQLEQLRADFRLFQERLVA